MVEIIDNDLYAQNARNCQLSGDQKKQEADNVGANFRRTASSSKWKN